MVRCDQGGADGPHAPVIEAICYAANQIRSDRSSELVGRYVTNLIRIGRVLHVAVGDSASLIVQPEARDGRGESLEAWPVYLCRPVCGHLQNGYPCRKEPGHDGDHLY